MAIVKPHEWQTAAAEAYSRLGGVVVDREPGSGKTYAAALIARRCARPLVVAPASVIPQTMKMFRSYGVPCYLAKDWGGETGTPIACAFASYTWLTRKGQADFFERYRPSDVLMDEYHEARGLGNSARKRLERDLIARPEVRVGVFSASLVTDRVTDYGPALTWALRGRARDLVPPTRAGLEALQERFDADPRAYAAFLARLDAHPGVFRDGDGVGRYSGEVVVRVIRREPALVLRDDWELPDGYLLVSPAQAASVSKMMAWGYWPRVTPRPSEAYLEARRAWAHTVRGVVATGAADTPEQVQTLRPKEYHTWLVAQDAEYRRVSGILQESNQRASVGSGEALFSMLDTVSLPRMGSTFGHTGTATNYITGSSQPNSVFSTDVTIESALTPTTSFSGQPPRIRETLSLRGAGPPASGTVGGSATPQNLKVYSDGSVETEAVWAKPLDLSGCDIISPRPTIVWAHHRALQTAAAEWLQCPHHGPGGRDRDGVHLSETQAGLVVASIEACHAGINAQHFSHNVWLECPSDPEVLRQGFGRTARQGQLAPRVTHTIVLACPAAESALRTAIARARVSGKKNPLLQLDGTDW